MPKINAPQIPTTITQMTKAMADQLIHHARHGNLSASDTASLKQAVDDIKGMDFLSTPPKGKTTNEHTVLIKPGVNWGINGYPTATSGESTYAMTRQTLEAAQQKGAKVNVIIGDESGIENK